MTPDWDDVTPTWAMKGIWKVSARVEKGEEESLIPHPGLSMGLQGTWDAGGGDS
jgi:hypothetical protein